MILVENSTLFYTRGLINPHYRSKAATRSDQVYLLPTLIFLIFQNTNKVQKSVILMFSINKCWMKSLGKNFIILKKKVLMFLSNGKDVCIIFNQGRFFTRYFYTLIKLNLRLRDSNCIKSTRDDWKLQQKYEVTSCRIRLQNSTIKKL